MGPCHMNARRHATWCFRKSWSRSIESAPPQAKTIQCYIHVTGLWCSLLCYPRIIWQTTVCLTDIFNEASARIKWKICNHKHTPYDWIVCVNWRPNGGFQWQTYQSSTQYMTKFIRLATAMWQQTLRFKDLFIHMLWLGETRHEIYFDISNLHIAWFRCLIIVRSLVLMHVMHY